MIRENVSQEMHDKYGATNITLDHSAKEALFFLDPGSDRFKKIMSRLLETGARLLLNS